MDPCEKSPPWLLRPLPVNAEVDEKLHQQIDDFARTLPGSIYTLDSVLSQVSMFRQYDAAANRASAYVWASLDDFYKADPQFRLALLRFASEHMTEEAKARVFRRLVKDPLVRVRTQARRYIEQSGIREVALPLNEKGAWDATGWFQGVFPGGSLSRHPQGKRVQKQLGLPQLTTIAELRELLGIKSPAQLGFFLLASDKDDGPYVKFTIPKRDGSDRDICAPKSQLRWVQRQILRKVLDRVPVHDAAHGFIPGRSTVTNAEKHRGSQVVLKFDLTDFFPSIHYFRVLGLFASLGYYAEDVRFRRSDGSRNVAATLARLCCYTPDPKSWGTAVVPQGAPTSPAISNLVCRRLDARLEGLAQRNNGVYTRYADDLTFSFKHKETDLGRFRWWVDQICHQEGFFINQKKFRVIRASQRQTVTGIVVNQELRVPRTERRKFRAILHNCRKDGVESQARGRKGFEGYLRGYASYIHMVHPEEGVELLRQVEELLGPEAE